MLPPRPPDGYSDERLDSTIHNRAAFACGNSELDDFLRTKASQNQEKHISATRVVLQTGKRDIVGYVTLARHDLPVIELPETAKRITNRDSIPTMLLARMAVDVAHQGRGLGDFLIRHSLHCGYNLWDTVGCHAIVVDAKNAGVKALYEKYGFIPFNSRPLRLYLPIGTLVKLVDSR